MYYEKLLERAGLKKTQQRILLLDCLHHAQTPMTAEELFAYMKQEKRGCSVSLSTVYRALEQFVEQGICSKSTCLDSDKTHYEFAAGRHRHFAVCLGCRKVEEIPSICPLPDERICLDGFMVTGHTLQLYGYCVSCREKQKL